MLAHETYCMIECGVEPRTPIYHTRCPCWITLCYLNSWKFWSLSRLLQWHSTTGSRDHPEVEASAKAFIRIRADKPGGPRAEPFTTETTHLRNCDPNLKAFWLLDISTRTPTWLFPTCSFAEQSLDLSWDKSCAIKNLHRLT